MSDHNEQFLDKLDEQKIKRVLKSKNDNDVNWRKKDFVRIWMVS